MTATVQGASDNTHLEQSKGFVQHIPVFIQLYPLL